ncbi:MAG: M1 family aminopeptidase [Bacteroidota bacterium]
MKSRTLFFLPFLFLFSHCQTQQPAVEIVPGVSLEIAQDRKDRLEGVRYQLHFAIPEDKDAPIEAELEVSFRLADAKRPLVLDFTPPTEYLHAMEVNGASVVPDHQEEHIVLKEADLVEDYNTVKIKFRAGDGSLNRQEEFLYTLLVPDRASTVFPCFDQPDLKAHFDLTLEVPSGWEALGNGFTKEVTETPEGNAFYRFATSDRIPTYLFTFVAGKFQRIERTIEGRTMEMFHREPDSAKVAANVDALFEEHALSLNWLEAYTGIEFPYQKFGFALIPSFQYGGMEHPGAIHYRARTLFLDESATVNNRLSRTRLIAHETAHMWFGNLVTMEWFNDVWLKEVFANFMAGKIAREIYPEVDHDLNFVMAHHPASYSVDRTWGANPVRQQLDNLKLAGTMYGAIIYNKAPIVIRQLENMMGEELFQQGVQEYLESYSHDNADWSDLVAILDKYAPELDLKTWSQVWINEPGRPLHTLAEGKLTQEDPLGADRVWPQVFDVGIGDQPYTYSLATATDDWAGPDKGWNSTGLGYGVFPVAPGMLTELPQLPNPLQRGALLINLYENMVEGRSVKPEAFLAMLTQMAATENNPQVLSRAMSYLATTYWTLLSPEKRSTEFFPIEDALWQALQSQPTQDLKKPVYTALLSVAQSGKACDQLRSLWEGEDLVPGLTLSTSDKSSLALNLMIKQPGWYDELERLQADRITNPDRKKRFEFVALAAHPDKVVRDSLFATFETAENRAIEPWVLGVLNLLHHPFRQESSFWYLERSLLWLEDIQSTGDIFFPKRWLDANFGSYSAMEVVGMVEGFLAERPDYSPNLKAKILQAYDGARRAAVILEGESARP